MQGPLRPFAPVARLGMEPLEDRVTPTFLARPTDPQLINVNGTFQPAGGLSIAIGNVIPEQTTFQNNEYVLGTGPGVDPAVRVYDLSGNLRAEFNPYAGTGFTGGVNVAVGDVTGDGDLEIIVAAASNPTGLDIPQVKVFSANGTLLSAFNVFAAAFRGGVNVAAGNVLGGISGGGGGNSTFKSEIIAGAAAGSSPHVVVADASGTIYRSFYAFDAAYRGGVTVAAASIDTTRTADATGGGRRVPDTNGYAEIIVGSATNVPHVKAFEVWQPGTTRTDGAAGYVERLSFYAFDPALGRGITVAAGSTDGNRGAELYVGLIGDPATMQTTVRAFSGARGTLLGEFQAFVPSYSRVVNMAIGNVIGFDPTEDDGSNFGDAGNPFFNTQDLAVVAGDGLLYQQPRTFYGLPNSAAGLNGP